MNLSRSVEWMGEVVGVIFKTIRRFSLVVLAAMMAMGSGIWLVHEPTGVEQTEIHAILLKILVMVAIGGPWLFVLKMAEERLGGVWRFGSLAGLAVIAVFACFLPHRVDKAGGAFWFSWACLLAGVHFLVAVLPYLGRGGKGFWAYNRVLLMRLIEAGIYAWVLCAGLEIANLSVEKLFHLFDDRTQSKIAGDLFFFCAFLFHPVFFLSGVGRSEGYEADEAYPKLLKVLTQVVLAPLCALYAVILYAYVVKMLCVRQWPNGWVTLPVTVFAVIGILAWLLLNPLRESDRWGRWFSITFPRLIGPLAVLMLLALNVRIQEYGLTEFRILGMVGGFWLIAFSLYYSFPRNLDLRMVPASLVVVAVLMSLGPLSASAIAGRSQKGRLDLLLAKVTAAGASDKEKGDFTSTLNYVLNWHGVGGLPLDIKSRWDEWRARNKDAQVSDYTYANAAQIVSALGISEKGMAMNNYLNIQLDQSKVVPLDHVVGVYKSVSLYGAGSVISGPFIFTFGKNRELSAKTMAGGESVDLGEVDDLLTSMVSHVDSNMVSLPPEKMTALFSHGGERYELVFCRVGGSKGESFEFSQVEMILVKLDGSANPVSNVDKPPLP